MKRPLALTLALILMSTIVLPVLADGEDFADSPDEFVPEIMSEHYISDRNYAIAFKSMYDGETWLYNAEEYFKVASVYKLPLNMYFYELENSVRIDPDTLIGGMTLEQCHYYSLEFSNNQISEAMFNYLGGYAEYKRLILPYTGYSEDELESDYYYDNAFTARMVLNILDYLYTNSEDFEAQIGHMLPAQPDQYLESGELDCDIAQKYGYETYNEVLHVAVAGIVYADEPFLITILTRGSYSAVDAMGELCDAFAAWDAERIAAIEAEKENQPEPTAEPDEPADETQELEAAALELAQAVCSVSPLPACLPWGELFENLLRQRS